MLIGDAPPVTMVPVPAVPAVPGTNPDTPYSTMKLLPADVKLTDAELVVIDPTFTAVGIPQVTTAFS